MFRICTGSMRMRMRVRIQHFRPVQIWIRIWILVKYEPSFWRGTEQKFPSNFPHIKQSSSFSKHDRIENTIYIQFFRSSYFSPFPGWFFLLLDPDLHSKCGSEYGSRSPLNADLMWIRIPNTGCTTWCCPGFVPVLWTLDVFPPDADPNISVTDPRSQQCLFRIPDPAWERDEKGIFQYDWIVCRLDEI
jgi:hypothetical protein